MTVKRTSDMTTAEHIARAKAELGAGDHESALVHALIAIAEQGQPIDSIKAPRPPSTVAIVWNRATGRPVCVFEEPSAAGQFCLDRSDVSFSEWPVLP